MSKIRGLDDYKASYFWPFCGHFTGHFVDTFGKNGHFFLILTIYFSNFSQDCPLLDTLWTLFAHFF